MMRKGAMLLVLALAASGCISPGSHVEQEARKTPVVQMTPTPPPQPPAPPVVTADQVTEANAAEKAQALAREMDFDANERPAAAPVMTNMTKP